MNTIAAGSTLKVAVAQMVSTGDIENNLSQASALIDEAAQQKVQLIALPENFAYFGRSQLCDIAQKESNSQGLIHQFLNDKANQHRIAILAGTMPALVLDSNGRINPFKVYACSTLWLPDEGLVASYNKCHLFDVDVGDEQGRYCESDSYAAGDSTRVYRLNSMKLGLSVCYDLRFPEFYRRLVEQGANIISVPSAFTYKTGEAHWEILLRARAIENQVFVLAPNQGGDHGKGRLTWGHSMIVDPWGTVMASVAVSGAGLAVAELNFDDLNRIRSKMPCLQHRKY